MPQYASSGFEVWPLATKRRGYQDSCAYLQWENVLATGISCSKSLWLFTALTLLFKGHGTYFLKAYIQWRPHPPIICWWSSRLMLRCCHTSLFTFFHCRLRPRKHALVVKADYRKRLMQHKRDTIAISLYSTCYLTYDRTVSGKHATRLQVSICCIFLFRSPV